MLRQSFLCCDRSFFGSLIICLAKSVVVTVLCCDNLMCGSFNSYVTTSTILLRQSFYAASSNLCRDSISVLVLVATQFLVLLEFLSRPRKFVSIEFCLHLT